MADLSDGAQEFRDLARTLLAVGLDDLRRELYTAIDDAAAPLAEEIRNPGHLHGFMPNRYADVLAGDLRVTTHKRTVGPETGVLVVARAPTVGRGGRKVIQRDEGRITHPVFARGPRRSWRWEVQTAGMRPGFFTDPVERAAPQVREAILAAMARIADKATGR